MERPYLLMSRTRTKGVAVWWKPKAGGYTENLHEAGRFSFEEAARWEHVSQGQALAVPEGALSLLTVRAILDLGDGRNSAWVDLLSQAHQHKPAFFPGSQPQQQPSGAAA